MKKAMSVIFKTGRFGKSGASREEDLDICFFRVRGGQACDKKNSKIHPTFDFVGGKS